MDKTALPKLVQKLKQMRKDLNMSQKELADRLHMQHNTISQYETGKRSITVEVYEKIFNLLDSELKKNKAVNIKGVRVVDVKYLETSRGVAFTGKIIMDETHVGGIEHKGDGGMIQVDFMDKDMQKEFLKRSIEYFKDNKDKLNVENDEELPSEAVIKESFAEELLDVHDFGKVLTEEEKMKLLFA